MSPDHIVIEGPDGAGKTALARVLCGALGYAYHHEGVPPMTIEPGLHYWNVIHQPDIPTVFDRLHVGEMIYGPILRGRSRITHMQMDAIDRELRTFNCSIIVCLPPWEVCIANSRMKWADELIQDELKLRAAYDAWAVIARTRGYRLYDYTKENLNVRNVA